MDENYIRAFIVKMVGARGFEPPTSCSQSRRATRLRYAPPILSDMSELDIISIFLWQVILKTGTYINVGSGNFLDTFME